MLLMSEDDINKDQAKEINREAAKVRRQLKAAITLLKKSQSYSSKIINYFGTHPNWPKAISDGEIEFVEDIFERAIGRNKIWIEVRAGYPYVPDTKKGKPGRPPDDICRDCEDMLTGLLSSTGLKQRKVAQHTFDLMSLAELAPASARSIEVRLSRQGKN
jgi:hypothetical protein